MITFEYTADGEAVADNAAESYVLRCWEESLANPIDHICKVSTANVVDAARMLVATGVLSAVSVQFKFQSIIISVNKNGELSSWPKGFCDHTNDWLRKIVHSRHLPK